MSWRRLAYDHDTGALAAVGDKTFPAGDLAGLLAAPIEAPPAAEPRYVPSARLARHVRARDVTCRFPGCTRRARRTELDHTVPWAKGGATVATNLHCLCKRHHRLKDENTDWSLKAHPDGSVTWTSPTGRQYTQQPHDYGDT